MSRPGLASRHVKAGLKITGLADLQLSKTMLLENYQSKLESWVHETVCCNRRLLRTSGVAALVQALVSSRPCACQPATTTIRATKPREQTKNWSSQQPVFESLGENRRRLNAPRPRKEAGFSHQLSVEPGSSCHEVRLPVLPLFFLGLFGQLWPLVRAPSRTYG